MRRILVLVAAMLWLVPGANADNGVLEINEACVSVGCFSGDDPGLPVEIENPGSYILTSNLVVPDEYTDGIRVNVSDVGIDLNNFAIMGPVTCSGEPVVCAPIGDSDGIISLSSAVSRTSIKNGSIRGFGRSGVNLWLESEITNIRASSNGRHGIWAASQSRVEGNTASLNGFGGIVVTYDSTVSGNTASRNRTGISTYDNNTILGNTTSQNSFRGISTDRGCTVKNNSSSRNLDTGIYVGIGSLVKDNTTEQNGGHGIWVGGGGSAQGNVARSNTLYGLYLSGATSDKPSYVGNTLSANVAGQVNGGVEIGTNLCNGSTTCP